MGQRKPCPGFPCTCNRSAHQRARGHPEDPQPAQAGHEVLGLPSEVHVCSHGAGQRGKVVSKARICCLYGFAWATGARVGGGVDFGLELSCCD